MVVKQVSVRLVAEGGGQLRAEFQGVGAAGEAAFLGIARATKSAETSAQTFTAALQAEDRAFEDLRASLDPAYASVRRYEAAVEAATRAVRFGSATQDQANAVIAQAQARMNGLDIGMGVVGSGATRMRGQVQNAAFQLGDFAVQVGVGTSASIALGQQLPQLLGGFGVLGAVIGAAVAAGIPLARVLFDTGEKAISAEDAVSDLSQSMDAYRGYVDLAALSTVELTARFGDFAEEIRGFNTYMQGVAIGDIMRDMNAATEPLKSGLSEIVSLSYQAAEARRNLLDTEALAAQPGSGVGLMDVRTATDNLELFHAAIRDTASEFGILPRQALQLAAALDDLNDLDPAAPVREIRNEAAEALQMIQKWYPAGADLSAEMSGLSGYLTQIIQQSAEISTEVETAALSVKDLSVEFYKSKIEADALSKIDINSGIAAAANTAGVLARNLGISLAAASAILAAGGGTGPEPVIFDPRDPRFNQDRANFAREQGFEHGSVSPFDLSRLSIPDISGAAGSAAGGGGGINPADREREEMLNEAMRIIEGTRTEQEKFNEAMARANELLDAGVLPYEAYTRHIDELRENLSDPVFDGLMKELGDVTDEIGKAFAQSESFAEAWDSLGDIFEAKVRQMAGSLLTSGLDALIEEAFGAMGGGGGGGGGWFATILGSLFGGARAGGGGVDAGKAYLINEGTANSEIFLPSRSGGVLNVPQSQAALRDAVGGGTVRIIIEEGPGFVARVRAEAQGVAVQVVRRAAPGIVGDAVGAVYRANSEVKLA